MKPIIVSAAVWEELDNALAFYARVGPGSEKDLYAEFFNTLETIQANPLFLPLFENTRARFAILPRFPYSVIFIECTEDIRILAFAHHSRRPGYWRRRLRDI